FLATWATGSPCSTRSSARRRNSGDFAAGILTPLQDDHRLRTQVSGIAGQAPDPVQARRDVGLFFRRLRASLGGKPLPYLWVPEWHKTDHGLHLHFALGQYVPRGHLVDAWGHGFVHIKRLSDMPVGSTTIHEARRAAGYL